MLSLLRCCAKLWIALQSVFRQMANVRAGIAICYGTEGRIGETQLLGCLYTIDELGIYYALFYQMEENGILEWPSIIDLSVCITYFFPEYELITSKTS